MSLLDALLARSPAQLLLRRRSAGRLVVLAYHAVEGPAPFARQLDHLLRRHRPVSLDLVLAALADEAELPPGAVLVTFDDADPTHLEVALPALAERGIPGAAFVVAGLLGTDRPFWWEEAAALAGAGGRAPGMPEDPVPLLRRLKAVPDPERRAALEALRATAAEPAPPRRHLAAADLPALEAGGIAVGGHSLDHPCLDRCDAAEVERQVGECHRILADALGRDPVAFAYPNGEDDPRAVAALRGLGYRAAFRFDHRVGPFPPTDPLRISRVRANAWTPIDRFRILASGLHPTLHHAIGRR